MFENVIYSNTFIELIDEDNGYYIKVKEKGYSIQELNELIKMFPRVKVTQFVSLKSALSIGNNKIIQLGEKKPLIELQISKDKLEASLFINLTQTEIKTGNYKDLIGQVLHLLNTEGVIFGFEINDIISQLKPQEWIVVAKGILPTRGAPAIVRYFEIEEAKPKVFENGDVNHYELNLINKVEKGDWVGERIEPKEGKPGKTVTGEIIPAQRGEQEKLRYDKKTINEVYDKERDVTFLYAAKTGAVVIEHDVISVCNYLEIEGKVSFKTGNIDFDGYVNIKDLIDDNFAVRAEHDIQVLGDMGVGSIEEIESRNGNVYIRGGISGKGKAKVICSGDLYTKFAADCDIECGGSVHIGFYAINCNIKAKEIVFDSLNSKVIGGSLKAQVRIKAGTVGNRLETTTHLLVEGFKRDKVKEEYDFINATFDKVKEKINLLKQKLSIYTITPQTESKEREEFQKLQDEYDYFRKNLAMLMSKQKSCISYLKAKGEGEIVITKTLYPKVHLTLKEESFWNEKTEKLPLTYYIDGNEIKKA